MGFLRGILTGVLGLAFLAAAGNAAYLSLTDRSGSEASAAAGNPTWPAALGGLFAPATDRATPPEAPAPTGPSAARIAEIEGTWRDWMTANGIAQGAMALALPDGRVIGAAMGRDPAAPVPVASLSKAITGLCLDGLLAERGLPWDSTLRDIATEMSAAGVTPRPWNEAITLSGLVTHSAGLEPDLTQGDMVARTHGALGLHRRIASEALAETALRGQPGRSFYANTNYAVLGVAVEALSGRSYAETCMERVVRPAGVTGAVIEGRMGSMSSYAGWEISAEDYARLARHWFTAGQPHVDAPETRPAAGSYAMGYSIDGAGRDARVTHNGRLCFDRATREGHGASFVALGQGTAFAATWGNCIDMALYDDLISAITPLLR
jgi:CubicO group peptidase (beta-lactamase class C family)